MATAIDNVAAGDFQGDGKLDLAVSYVDTTTLAFGNGGDPWERRWNVSGASDQPGTP